MEISTEHFTFENITSDVILINIVTTKSAPPVKSKTHFVNSHLKIFSVSQYIFFTRLASKEGSGFKSIKVVLRNFPILLT